MSAVAPESRDVSPRDAEAADAGFSPVVAAIFDALLEAIHSGRMPPGQRISDGNLAAEFRVSRTPVREALQRLRDLGVVEAVAGKYTRVAIVTPVQTADALVVWAALYGALVEEVIEDSVDVSEAMAREFAAVLQSVAERDFPAIATATFSFFDHLMGRSNNPALRDGITRVVHLVRLGSLHLPHSIDIEALADGQRMLLAAVANRDRQLARAAMARFRTIEVPLEEHPTA